MTAEHGTRNRYVNYRCRCDECRDANRRYQADLRERLRQERDDVVLPHGRVSTYINWGCRCEDCTEANSRRHREWRKRKRAQR